MKGDIILFDAGLVKIYTNGQGDYDVQIRNGNSDLMQDAEPTRYAEWLYVDEYDDLRRCSECDYEVKTENISQYCPHCGAKMDGGEE